MKLLREVVLFNLNREQEVVDESNQSMAFVGHHREHLGALRLLKHMGRIGPQDVQVAIDGRQGCSELMGDIRHVLLAQLCQLLGIKELPGDLVRHGKLVCTELEGVELRRSIDMLFVKSDSETS